MLHDGCGSLDQERKKVLTVDIIGRSTVSAGVILWWLLNPSSCLGKAPRSPVLSWFLSGPKGLSDSGMGPQVPPALLQTTGSATSQIPGFASSQLLGFAAEDAAWGQKTFSLNKSDFSGADSTSAAQVTALD